MDRVLSAIENDRIKFNENVQLWNLLNEQIHKALFDENWLKVVESAEKALSIKMMMS